MIELPTADNPAVLVCGDALEVLASLPDGCVDAVVTDPPYGMANNTDSRRFSGGNRALRRGEGRDDWPEVCNDRAPFDPAPWLDFPRVVLWGWHHFAGRTPPGSVLVWIKKADHLFGTFLSDAELAWMKGGCGVYCHRKQFPPPVRIAEGGGKCLHPNQKPVSLMAWCLEVAKVPPGGLVFDPYMGSATCAIACLQTGRRYLGAEINPAYHAVAQKRVADYLSSGPLFAAVEQPTLFGEGDQ